MKLPRLLAALAVLVPTASPSWSQVVRISGAASPAAFGPAVAAPASAPGALAGAGAVAQGPELAVLPGLPGLPSLPRPGASSAGRSDAGAAPAQARPAAETGISTLRAASPIFSYVPAAPGRRAVPAARPSASGPSAAVRLLPSEDSASTGRPEEGPTAVAAAWSGDIVFDGRLIKGRGLSALEEKPAVPASEAAPAAEAAGREGVPTAPAPSAGRLKKALRVLVGSEPPAPGRPSPEKLSFLGRVGYGAKWGVLLLGISQLLSAPFAIIAQLHAHAPADPNALPVPAPLLEALSQHPLFFVTAGSFLSVVTEELTFRVLTFLSIFGALKLAGWISRRTGAALARFPGSEAVKENLRGWGDWLGGLSRHAFWVAGTISAASFSYAHFALWGPSLAAFIVRFQMGFLMAGLMVKSRSLIVPVMAHYVNNTLAFIGLILTYVLGWTALGSAWNAALLVLPSLLFLRQVNVWLHTPRAPKA